MRWVLIVPLWVFLDQSVTVEERGYSQVNTCVDLPTFNYKQKPTTSRVQCAVACSQEPNCMSFSIPMTGPSLCYLNNATFKHTGCSYGTFKHFSLEKSPERPCWHGGSYNTTTSDCICYNGYIGNWCQTLMQDCSEGWNLPYYNKLKAVFSIHPITSPYPFKVFCEMVHKGKLVILRNTPDALNVDFNRTFTEYKDGFGDLEGNVWMGLQRFHYLTNHRNMTFKVVVKTSGVAIKMTDFRQRFYNDFRVSNETDGYRFTFSASEIKPGTSALGDCLTDMVGLPFSTIDNDRDTKVGNCAKIHLSGWWYKKCGPCNPMGKLQPTSERIQNDDPWYIHMPIDGDLAALEVKLMLSYHG
ncbi:microfibril-associated glycoprotein 4-like [Haliotis cracherodii]|uniref:microfibril-associated glycoprotein 4-like n=1 Tax=Haliotis cracherodii TaxID=6455 RepID=UPI0039E9B852